MGAIVSLGSDPKEQPRSESILIYSPPYLYKGTRPTIVSAPDVIKRTPISVTTTGGANRITFTRAPAPTHGMDPGDGYLSFPIRRARWTWPGRCLDTAARHYRMWAVNSKGAVSKAKWVYMCHPAAEGTDCGCC